MALERETQPRKKLTSAVLTWIRERHKNCLHLLRLRVRLFLARPAGRRSWPSCITSEYMVLQ